MRENKSADKLVEKIIHLGAKADSTDSCKIFNLFMRTIQLFPREDEPENPIFVSKLQSKSCKHVI